MNLSTVSSVNTKQQYGVSYWPVEQQTTFAVVKYTPDGGRIILDRDVPLSEAVSRAEHHLAIANRSWLAIIPRDEFIRMERRDSQRRMRNDVIWWSACAALAVVAIWLWV